MGERLSLFERDDKAMANTAPCVARGREGVFMNRILTMLFGFGLVVAQVGLAAEPQKALVLRDGWAIE